MKNSTTSSLPSLIQDVKSLAKASGVTAWLPELTALYIYAGSEAFRVVVCAGPAGGSSTLINNLLGEEWIPTDFGSYMDIPVSITYGNGVIRAWTKDGRIGEDSLNAGSWKEIMEQKEWMQQVELQIKSKVLDQNDRTFTDYKKINLSNPGEIEKKQIISYADAVLYVVNAEIGMTFMEKDVLRDLFLKNGVPHIIVVTDKQELVPKEEKAPVIEYLRQELNALSSSIGLEDMEDLQNLKEQIDAWCHHDELRNLRTRAVQRQLAFIIDKMEAELYSLVDLFTQKQRARQGSQQEIKEASERQGLGWVAIKNALQKKVNECIQQTQAFFETHKNASWENIRTELSLCKDPKEWWEKRFPPRFRREMTLLSRDYEIKLTQKIQQDLADIRHMLKVRFDRPLLSKDPGPAMDHPDMNSHPSSRNLSDISNLRGGIRVVAALIASLAFGGLPVIFLGGAALSFFLGEKYVTLKVKQQIQELSIQIYPLIQEAFDVSRNTAVERIGQYYDALLEDLENTESHWKSEQADRWKGDASLQVPQLTATTETLHALKNIKTKLETL